MRSSVAMEVCATAAHVASFDSPTPLSFSLLPSRLSLPTFAMPSNMHHVHSLPHGCNLLHTHLPSCKSSSPDDVLILGESLKSEEHDLYPPAEQFRNQALLSSRHQYDILYKKSIEDPDCFWSDIACDFFWKKKWQETSSKVHFENFDVRKGKIEVEWFKGGTTNICYNAVDRHVEAGKGDDVAIYWEGNDPGYESKCTFKELLHCVCQLANYLREIGVGKGDAVAIYLPMLVELPIAMLACARIGAVHSVVFAGFSADSLAQRILDCGPKVIITCSGVRRGSKIINLKEIVDEALSQSNANGVSVDVCLTYANDIALKREDTPWKEGRDVWWQDVIPVRSAICPIEWVDAEDPLFLLYTSGSTGKPKGVLHTTGGYMVYTATTFKHAFDYHPGDIFWCTADCGWITGHSYVTYGPLLNGATIVVFEGVPTYPDAGRCWEIVDKYKVTLFYTAPTAIRSLMREGDEVKGQAIYAFVTLKEGVPYSEELRSGLRAAVRTQIGAFATPGKIHWAPMLPKTRSGKIMRRILRKIASKQYDELGDISTLADPGVVEQLIVLTDY